jgi:hypothetical protein
MIKPDSSEAGIYFSGAILCSNTPEYAAMEVLLL